MYGKSGAKVCFAVRRVFVGVSDNRCVSLSTMSVWRITRYSDNISASLALSSDTALPLIKRPNEALVRVLAASVNPIDVTMSGGYGQSVLAAMSACDQFGIDRLTYDTLPLTLGRDFSGVVVDVGRDVRAVRVGQHVFGSLPPHVSGAHSQYVVANERYMYEKPQNVSHVSASSLPYAALTAWSAICTYGSITERNAFGKRILVLGGSGGVGTVAIQLLKHWGAHVITTCSESAIEFVYSNTGADQCIDYNSSDLISNYGPFDLILNASPGHHFYDCDRIVNCLRKWSNAKYVTLSPPLLSNTDKYGLLLGTALSAVEASRETINSATRGASVRWAFYRPNWDALRTISHLLQTSSLKPIVDKVFNFKDTPLAYLKVQSGHARGKTVIDFNDETNV